MLRAGYTVRTATSHELKGLHHEADALKECVADRPSRPSRIWNRIPKKVYDQIIDLALERPELSPRELAVPVTDRQHYFVSEARLLKAHDLITSPAYVAVKPANEFKDKTTRPYEMWQTDFTYFKIIGWGWIYLSIYLPCSTITRATSSRGSCAARCGPRISLRRWTLEASGYDQAHVHNKPRLLSDNGPSYIANQLAQYIEAQKLSHVRGAPFHPQAQGKIERWHQALKYPTLLENYFLPGDLEAQIEAFVEHYNHQRYRERLNNITPADAYFGRAHAIIQQPERIKKRNHRISALATPQGRRIISTNQMEPTLY